MEALEAKAEQLEREMEKQRREHKEEARSLRGEIAEVEQEAREGLGDLRDKVETFVDGTPREWVGVSWLLLGILAAGLAEFL